MSKHLEVELAALKQKLFTLTALVDEVLIKAVRSLKEKNKPLAKEVIDLDNRIDQMEVEVEEECLKIMALHQPVAIDLRYIIGVLKMNNDLERIGDLAVNISERTLYILKGPEMTENPFNFDLMVEKTHEMVKKCFDALVNMDVDLAKEVMHQDNEVDDINREMHHLFFDEVKKSPGHIVTLMSYLSVSRHLERIADYATNIAEDVIYMVEGTIVRHNPDIYDQHD